MKVYYFKEDLRNVTEFYYNIILDALRKTNADCIMLDSCSIGSVRGIAKDAYVLATTLKSFAILYITGHRNFIYWYQGITPEEVCLMTGSKLRFKVYSFLEKLSLKTVKYKIGVSKYLFEHFEEKYKMQIDRTSVFIMPCFNSELNEDSFNAIGKYDKNVFCYAGGVQAWQGFDAILKIYSEIESKRNDVYLKIYSKEIDKAKVLIDEARIRNYSVDCVSQSEMDKALADCKFGFIIREDSIINNVATPTKLGTYLANGVIPIFSSTVMSFRDLSTRYNYLCCVDNNFNVADQIIAFMNNSFEGEKISKEYKRIFEDYFNRESYVQGLASFLNS